MFMEKIIGLIDAPFTPFYANGDVNPFFCSIAA